MFRFALMLCLVALPYLGFAQSYLSPQQKAVMDFYYAKAKTNTIDGAWIIDGTVPLSKLSTNLQQIILLPFQIETVSSNTTLDFLQRTILVDTTLSSVDVTIPSSSVITGTYYEVKFVTGANDCNVVPDGVETIDGTAGAFKLYSGESISIQADGGSNWLIL